MNAHKFVAVHGIEKAKAVLKGAPSEAKHFEFIKTAFIKTAIYMQFCGGEWFWLNTNCNEWLLDYPNGITERQCLKELKQVVDLVTSYRGITEAKAYMTRYFKLNGAFRKDYPKTGKFITQQMSALEKAIADYELVEASKGGDE